MVILILLLVLWLALAVIGFMFKALLWLAFVGLALLAITIAAGGIHWLGKRP